MFIEKTGNIYYGAYWDERNIETRLASSTNLFTGWNIIASGKSWYGTNFPTYTSFPDGSYKEGACIRYFDGKWRLWISDVLGGRSGIYSEGLTPTGMSFVSLINAGNYRLEHGTIINSNDVANMIYYSGLVNQYSNQNISGLKNFRIRPTVNGTGVLLQGEAAAGNIANVVFTTGSQIITGPKNFTARPTLSGVPLITTGDLVNLELNIEGALSASTDFNGNRPIRRIPVLNTNYGGTTISGFLNNLFFPYTQISLSISNFTTKPYGLESVSAQIYAGNIVEGDDSITGIAYMSGERVLQGPSSRTTFGNYSTSPLSVPFASPIIANTNEIFKTRIYGTRSGNAFTSDSSNTRLRFEPVYYWGVSSNPNLTATDILATPSPLNRVDPNSNSSFYSYGFGSRPSNITQNFIPNGQYIYLVYPSFARDGIIDWGTVTNIRDLNTNLTYSLTSYTTGQLTINLAQQTNMRYRFYRSTDIITPINPSNPSTYRMEFTLGGTV
jgi:hypothetical protein